MLKLPLKYYDDAGRILPPKWLYAILMLFSLDWLAFIFSLASRSQTEVLLSLFYPHRISLGLALLSSFPIVIGLTLIGQRERLWKRGFTQWCSWLIPLILTGMGISLLVQLYHASAIHWGFEPITAIKMMLAVMGLYCVGRSRHVRWMIDDWKKPINSRP